MSTPSGRIRDLHSTPPPCPVSSLTHCEEVPDELQTLLKVSFPAARHFVDLDGLGEALQAALGVAQVPGLEQRPALQATT